MPPPPLVHSCSVHGFWPKTNAMPHGSLLPCDTGVTHASWAPITHGPPIITFGFSKCLHSGQWPSGQSRHYASCQTTDMRPLGTSLLGCHGRSELLSGHCAWVCSRSLKSPGCEATRWRQESLCKLAPSCPVPSDSFQLGIPPHTFMAHAKRLVRTRFPCSGWHPRTQNLHDQTRLLLSIKGLWPLYAFFSGS